MSTFSTFLQVLAIFYFGGIIIDFSLPLIVFIVINEISKRIQETFSTESVTKW